MISDDEYVDYSCSTPVERLSRDIETVLRSWHVVAGSDRHVSLRPRTRQLGDDSNSKGAVTDTQVHLLRSARLQLITSVVSDPTNRVTVDLDLCLWDAPEVQQHDTQPDNTHLPLRESPPFPFIPFSLISHRNSTFHGDLVNNLSTLFGIGQHITLSPSSQMHCTQLFQCTLSTILTADRHRQLKHKRMKNVFKTSTLEDTDTYFTYCLTTIQSLSNILQTALNFAASSCDCRIPTFGMWGAYPLKENSQDDYSRGLPTWLNPAYFYNLVSHSISSAQQYEDETENNDLTNDIHDHHLDTNGTFGVSMNSEEHGHNSPSRHFFHSPSRRSQYKQKLHHQQKRHFLPVFSGYCYPGPSSAAIHASFALHIVPPGMSYPLHASTLNRLGQMFLQQLNVTRTKRFDTTSPYGKVVVTFARHEFSWNQQKHSHPDDRHSWSYYWSMKDVDKLNVYTHGLEWRKSLCPDSYPCSFKEPVQKLIETLVRVSYHAFNLAHRSSRLEPLWGPKEDPLKSISVSVTWHQPNSLPSVDTENMKAHLLVLPLRIRSHRSLSSHDMNEMENTILSTIFNPITAPPHSFMASSTFSKDCAYGTLSANIRCILAALIRTCSLEPDTLLGHLTKPQVLETFQDQMLLEDRLNRLMNTAQISNLTRNLVQALDWEDADIEHFDSRSLAIDLLDSGRFQIHLPSFGTIDEKHSLPFHRFSKTCCPGSFMSIVSMCIGSLRKPSKICCLWLDIVDELRHRWARLETIKNVIPSAYSMEQIFSPRSSTGTTDRVKLNTLSPKMVGASYLFSSEHEPDCNDCLLSQKFQVYNIGVEIMIATNMEDSQMKQFDQSRNPKHTAKSNVKKYGDDQSETATDIIRNRKHDDSKVHDAPTMLADVMRSTYKGSSPPSIDHVMDGEEEIYQDLSDSISEEGNSSQNDQVKHRTSPSIHSNRTSSKYEFYDAQTFIENATLDKASDDRSDGGSNYTGCENFNATEHLIEEVTASVVHRQKRQGARCPVHGVNLIASGDQLYAPYLLRSAPITDEVIYLRRLLLQKNMEGLNPANLKSSLEIIQRLQKPKLLSDVRAFKAANPGAIFQDFVNWYGNPGDPIAEFIGDDAVSFWSLAGCRDVEAEASIASSFLSSTRTFWSDIWDQADPCPSIDQRPLFDPTSTVETLLSSLETLHPSILLNQVLSVNMSMACFLLEQSACFCRTGSVQTSLERLYTSVHQALSKLNNDMTLGALSPVIKTVNDEGSSYTISHETISACESVCDIIGEVEVLLSQTASLSSKMNSESTTIVEELVLNQKQWIEEVEKRNHIFTAIQSNLDKQIARTESERNNQPTASVREYILRTIDRTNSPCQMSVRIGNSDDNMGDKNAKGGIVVSISKCN